MMYLRILTLEFWNFNFV